MSKPSPLQCVLDPNAHFFKTVTIHKTLTPNQAKRMLQQAPLSATERRLVFQNYEQQLDALKYHCHAHTRGAFKKRAAKILSVAHTHPDDPLYGGASGTAMQTRHMRKIMHLYDTQNVINHTNYVRGQLAGGHTPVVTPRPHVHDNDAIKIKKIKKTVNKSNATKKIKKTRGAFTNEDILVAEVAEKTILHRIREEGVCDLMVNELSKGVTKLMKENFAETIQVEQVVNAKHPQMDKAKQTGWMNKLKEWGGNVLDRGPTVTTLVKFSAKWSLRGSLWMFNFMLKNPAQASFFLLFVKIVMRTVCRNIMRFMGQTVTVDKLKPNAYDDLNTLKSFTGTALLKTFMKTGYKGAFLFATSSTLRLLKIGWLKIPHIGSIMNEVCAIFIEFAGEAVRSVIEFNIYRQQLNDNWQQIVDIFNLLTRECLVKVEILDTVHQTANQLGVKQLKD